MMNVLPQFYKIFNIYMMNNLNADKMKSKELRRIIREAISEVIKETSEQDVKNAKKAELDARIKAADVEKALASQQKTALGENDIDEMARTAKGYRLTNDAMDVTQYANKRVSGVSLADILNYIRDNPGVEKKDIQTQFNFVRPQITNALMNGLSDAGVISKIGAGGEVEPAPGEEEPTQAIEPEDMFMGSSENPLAMYFDNEPNDDGSEDFEPESGEVEKVTSVANKMSDEDYEASIKYRELEQRLGATKSNILKLKKSSGNVGDIKDKPSEELQRLRTLKASLEQRLNDLIASNDYVKKLAGVEIPKPPVDNTVNEETEPLDEWTVNKLQYYAGIKK